MNKLKLIAFAICSIFMLHIASMQDLRNFKFALEAWKNSRSIADRDKMLDYYESLKSSPRFSKELANAQLYANDQNVPIEQVLAEAIAPTPAPIAPAPIAPVYEEPAPVIARAPTPVPSRRPSIAPAPAEEITEEEIERKYEAAPLFEEIEELEVLPFEEKEREEKYREEEPIIPVAPELAPGTRFVAERKPFARRPSREIIKPSDILAGGTEKMRAAKAKKARKFENTFSELKELAGYLHGLNLNDATVLQENNDTIDRLNELLADIQAPYNAEFLKDLSREQSYTYNDAQRLARQIAKTKAKLEKKEELAAQALAEAEINNKVTLLAQNATYLKNWMQVIKEKQGLSELSERLQVLKEELKRLEPAAGKNFLLKQIYNDLNAVEDYINKASTQAAPVPAKPSASMWEKVFGKKRTPEEKAKQKEEAALEKAKQELLSDLRELAQLNTRIQRNPTDKDKQRFVALYNKIAHSELELPGDWQDFFEGALKDMYTYITVPRPMTSAPGSFGV